MKSQSQAIKKLCDSRSKVSAHYFIKDDGKIINLVPDLYEAWHAGKSSWKNLKKLNRYSIGIEINNPGHDHGYRKFKDKQISALKKLLSNLTNKYKATVVATCGNNKNFGPDNNCKMVGDEIIKIIKKLNLS